MRINNLEKFLGKIRAGKIARGCCVTLSDSTVTEIAADAGLDFCWIDGEHGVMDRETMLQHIMALRGTDCAPFVRVPDASHTEVKKIIDMAPAAVIIPMVTTMEEAENAVAACRYPPEGNRGCGFRRGNRFGADSIDRYLEISRHEPLVFLQIEHMDAVRILDRILEIPGMDGILIGPCDLSASLGKIARLDDQGLNAILDEICLKTRNREKLLGAYAPSDLESWIRRGIQWVSLTNDVFSLYDSLHHFASADLKEL